MGMDPVTLSMLASAGGSILGGIEGSQQQGQLGNAFNQLFGEESGAIGQLMSSYFGQGGAGSIMSQIMPQLQQYIGGNEQGVNNAANTLMNWKGLRPEEVSALQTTLNNSGMSTVNTLRNEMGGAANPNAIIGQSLGADRQNSLNLGTQLGGLASSQELQARESGGSLLSGLLGQNLGALGQFTGQQSGLLGEGLSGLSGMTGQIGQMMTGMGSPWGTALGGLAQNPILQGMQVGGGKGGPSTGATPTGGGAPFQVA